MTMWLLLFITIRIHGGTCGYLCYSARVFSYDVVFASVCQCVVPLWVCVATFVCLCELVVVLLVCLSLWPHLLLHVHVPAADNYTCTVRSSTY